LPSDSRRRAAVLLAIYGSPDLRQVDGIGGADPLTSKAAVVNRASSDGADLDYTFYQVGIDVPRVSMGGTCGNMLAAVAPFALLRGLLRPPSGSPEMAVRIHATNTGQIFVARFGVQDGYARVDGDCRIAGVPGTSSSIKLDFGDCAGSMSGKLLPTGNATDVIQIDSQSIQVSLVDAATPFVFVRARDIGAIGHELPPVLVTLPGVMQKLEAVRSWAAVVLRLVKSPSEARTTSPNVPRVVMVSPPTGYMSVNGRAMTETDMDVCVRQLAMQRPHKALAVTGSVCAAVAARVKGTVVADCFRASGDTVRLGHPSGVTNVNCRVNRDGVGRYRIDKAEIERTSRLIMHGSVLARESHIEDLLSLLELSDSAAEEAVG